MGSIKVDIPFLVLWYSSAYAKRSKWAKELVDYLVLCFEDNIPPHSVQGSCRCLGMGDSFHPALSPIQLMATKMVREDRTIGMTLLLA